MGAGAASLESTAAALYATALKQICLILLSATYTQRVKRSAEMNVPYIGTEGVNHSLGRIPCSWTDSGTFLRLWSSTKLVCCAFDSGPMFQCLRDLVRHPSCLSQFSETKCLHRTENFKKDFPPKANCSSFLLLRHPGRQKGSTSKDQATGDGWCE